MNIVYKTTNLVNGMIYYGVHCADNPNYLGSGVNIANAIKEFGRENFKRETLATFVTEEMAYAFEKILVNGEVVDDPNCYNKKEGGIRSGWKHTEEAKRKISIGHLGLPSPTKGIPHTAETKAKMSASKKGKKFSEAHKVALCAAQKRRWMKRKGLL